MLQQFIYRSNDLMEWNGTLKHTYMLCVYRFYLANLEQKRKQKAFKNFKTA